MAGITIRDLDDEVKTRLRVRAASNSRSMEEEARNILGEAVEEEAGPRNLGHALRERFAPMAEWIRRSRRRRRCASRRRSIELQSGCSAST